jgi:hypothetical protein
MKTLYFLINLMVLPFSICVAMNNSLPTSATAPTSQSIVNITANQSITVSGIDRTQRYNFIARNTPGSTAVTFTLPPNSLSVTTIHIDVTSDSMYVRENRPNTVKQITLPATLTITPGTGLSITGGTPPPLTPAINWTGLPYDDAVMLQNLLKTPKDTIAKYAPPLFANYYGLDNITVDALSREISSNIYLKPLLTQLQSMAAPNRNKAEFAATIADKSEGDKSSVQLAGLGAMSPTVAIDALGTFIAKRFREEINAAYLDRFRLALRRPDSLHYLVPETYKVLRYSDPYNYTSFLQTLQESFDDDLRHLPFNTNAYMSFNRKKMEQLMKSPVLFDLTATTLHIVSEIQDDKDALVILNEIGKAKTTDSTKNNTLKAGIKLVSLLSRNIYVTKANSLSLLSNTEWGKLRTETQLRDLFVGLILERERQTFKGISLTVTSGTSTTAVTLYNRLMDTTLRNRATQFLRYADTLRTTMSALKTIKGKINKEKEDASNTTPSRKPETVGFTFALIDNSLSALTTGINLTNFILSPTASNTIVLKDWQGYVQNTRRLLPSVRYIFEKRYGMALSGVVTFLREIMPEINSRVTAETDLSTYSNLRAQIHDSQKRMKKIQRTSKQLQKVNAKLTAALSNSTTAPVTLTAYKDSVSNLTTVIDTLIKARQKRITVLTKSLTILGSPQTEDDSKQRCAIRNTLLEKTGELMKYGTFMVTVVQSKTKDEMLQALETAALPVGSYRIKRNNWFSVSINSFGGVYGGGQFSTGSSKLMFAPSAPIGAYLGWGKEQAYVNKNNGQSNGKDGQSNGIFISLLDIGAVAAFRVNSGNDTTKLPELTWKNVLAPGIYYVHGFRNVLSVGVGVQYGPELSKIGDKAGFDPQAFRVGIKLTADIPLFNLYTKANKSSTDRCQCKR